MDILLNILVGALGTWITLMIVVPIAGRIARFSFPGLGAAAWKLAVVALVTNALTVVVALASGFVGWVAGLIVFWVLMVKWFDVDLLGAVLIVVISWLVRIFLVGAIIGLIASGMA
jgi:hypothetical protein